jgi:hypothetical protein
MAAGGLTVHGEVAITEAEGIGLSRADEKSKFDAAAGVARPYDVTVLVVVEDGVGSQVAGVVACHVSKSSSLEVGRGHSRIP